MATTIVWDNMGLVPSLLLLKQAHIRFSSALQGTKQQNHVVFFKSTLVQLSWVLDWLHYSKESSSTCPKALPGRLENALNQLERLVLDAVRNHEIAIRNRYSKKLKILVDLPISDASKFFDFGNLEDSSVRDDVKDAVEKCIESLRSLSTPPSLNPGLGLSYSNEDLRRREICVQYWKQLYDHLSKHSSNCDAEKPRNDHRVKVAIETLGPCAPKLHLLLSTCDVRASQSPLVWQSANFEHEPPKRSQDVSRSVSSPAPCGSEMKWCAQLQMAQQERQYTNRPMRFAYSDVDLRTTRRPPPESRPFPRYASKSNLMELSVSSLGQPPSHEPKYMQCLLAHSLWLLYRTPWASGFDVLQGFSLITVLDPGTTEKGSDCVHVAQSPLWTSAEPQQVDDYFMERFGLLLLQIECPNYLERLFPGMATEIDDLELVEHLMDLAHENSIEEQLHVSQEWARVLITCLSWDNGNDYEATYILENIFNPLQQELREQQFREFTHGLSKFELPDSRPSKPYSVQTYVSKGYTQHLSPGIRMYDDLTEGDSQQ